MPCVVEFIRRFMLHAPAVLTSILSKMQGESGKNLLFHSEKGRRNMAFCRRNPQRSGFFEITSCGVKKQSPYTILARRLVFNSPASFN
jgi:hypothetical protein